MGGCQCASKVVKDVVDRGGRRMTVEEVVVVGEWVVYTA